MAPRKNNSKKKTSFTRGKRKSGLSAAVMAAETKIQKNIIDIMSAGYDRTLTASGWYTPYCDIVNTTPIENGVFNPNIYQTPLDSNTPILNGLGTFITNGDERNQRNGRRITMLTSISSMVFHMQAKNTAVPGGTPIYAYSVNPQIRVIQGWCKLGIAGLSQLRDDITSLYSEIPFVRYLVKYDKVLSRRAMESGAEDPIQCSYAPFKFNFLFRPNRRITFSGASSGPATNAQNITYDGWVPFVYIFQPNPNMEILFDNIKRVNIYKDL